jgi:Kef-type K+ transport system membrane component KefB
MKMETIIRLHQAVAVDVVIVMIAVIVVDVVVTETTVVVVAVTVMAESDASVVTVMIGLHATAVVIQAMQRSCRLTTSSTKNCVLNLAIWDLAAIAAVAIANSIHQQSRWL